MKRSTLLVALCAITFAFQGAGAVPPAGGQTSIDERTKYDIFYVEHWSLAFDVRILLRTIGTVLRGKNAY